MHEQHGVKSEISQVRNFAWHWIAIISDLCQAGTIWR